MAFDSWCDLGEGIGNQGDKPELWRIECAFCGVKGNFELAFHGERKNPTSAKKINFDVYKCGNCTGFIHVLWSAGDGWGRGLYDMRVMPWPLDGKREPSENWTKESTATGFRRTTQSSERTGTLQTSWRAAPCSS